MKNLFIVSGGVLLLLSLGIVLFRPTEQSGNSPSPTMTPAAPVPSATTAPTVTASYRERLVEQIRQLAREYEKAVQAEKKNGSVEFSRDPQTGAELFRFKDEGFVRVDQLYSDFLLEKTKLENLYTQFYRDEIQPTPFPTFPAGEEQAAYDARAAQAESFCSLESWQRDPNAESMWVYQPDEGRYGQIFMGEVIARCNLFGQMLEEARTARVLASVDQAADIVAIEKVLGGPSAGLTFDSIGALANAPWRTTSVYTDGTGTRYYVDVETGRLAQVEPNFVSHPQVPDEKRLKIEQLRAIAEGYALANSEHLADIKPEVQYEEGAKGDIFFFRWDYRKKDWSGTEWAMMPPFLQVGVLADGQVVIYLNTLDLAVE